MFQPVTFIDVLLKVLLFALAFRAFFQLRQKDRFIAGMYFLCALGCFALYSFWRGMTGWIGMALILGLFLQWLYQGSLVHKLLYGLAVLGLLAALEFLNGWLLQTSLLQESFPATLQPFAASLLSQIDFYILLFGIQNLYYHRRYSFTYYLVLTPVLITYGIVFASRSLDPAHSLHPLLAPILLVALLIDFGCLILQSWMLASLRTRQQVKREQVQREYLMYKYETLEKQYEKSFGFLHQLLRACADLSCTFDETTSPALRQQAEAIARQAFEEFNAVCINAPVLSNLLESRRPLLEQEKILVSTVIRNDHFGLLTFQEQEELFAPLLEFALQQCLDSKQAVRTIVIKSTKQDTNILMQWIFPADPDAQSTPAFGAMQKTISRRFKAGLNFNWQPDGKGRLMLALPLFLPTQSAAFGGSLADIRQKPAPKTDATPHA